MKILEEKCLVGGIIVVDGLKGGTAAGVFAECVTLP